VMTASWGGICCSEPPCVAVSLRTTSYSFVNIRERKAFTISSPSEAYFREADYFGMASGRETDKFAVTKLTEELWQKWGQPDIWRVPHGHFSFSLVGAPGLMASQVLAWLAPRLGESTSKNS